MAEQRSESILEDNKQISISPQCLIPWKKKKEFY